MQDAFAPTSGFSAVGVCAGQVAGGARNCCFWFTGFPNCSENQKNVKTILLRDEWNAVFDSKMIHFVSFLSSPWMTIIT